MDIDRIKQMFADGYALIPLNHPTNHKKPNAPAYVASPTGNATDKWQRFKAGMEEADFLELWAGDHDGCGWVLPEDVVVIDLEEKNNRDHDNSLVMRFLNDVGLQTTDFCVAASKSANPVSKKKGGHLIYRVEEGVEEVKKSGNGGVAKQMVINEETGEWAGGYKTICDVLTGHSGCYIAVDPTPGYMWVNYLPIDQIPVKSKEEHKRYMAVLRSWDESIRDRNEQVTKDHNKEWKLDTTSVIDLYNNAMTLGRCLDLLTKDGWTEEDCKNGTYYLRRPQKAAEGRAGHSATLRISAVGRPNFHVFSAGGTAFEEGQNYGPFGIYACIKFNGDYTAAGKALWKAYKERMDAAAQSARAEEESSPASQDEAREEDSNVSAASGVSLETDRFYKMKEDPSLDDFLYKPGDYSKMDWEPFWSYKTDGHDYLIGGPGMIMGLIGWSGTRKTTFLSTIIDNGLSGATRIDQHVALKGKSICVFDYEQSDYAHKKQGKKLDRWALNGLYYYRFTDMTKQDKRARTIAACERHRPAVIILDNAKELVFNAMDENSADEGMSMLMHLRDKYNALVIPILHKSKAGIGGRGNFGSVLEFYADAMLDFEFPENQWGQQSPNPPTKITFRKLRDDKKPHPIYVTHASDGFLKFSEQDVRPPAMDYSDADLGLE